MKGLLYKIFLFFVLLTLFTCKPEKKIREVDASIIEYRVDYIDKRAGSIPTSILPGKMTLFFSGNYAMNIIEGFFGQFSLVYIANLRKESVITMLKLFDKNYYYQGKSGELPVGIRPMNNMVTSKTDSSKVLCGFHCQGWKMTSEGKQERYIFGTDELNVKSPNITTPYRDHDQVLLEFYTGLSVLDMKLTAQDYREEKILNTIFFVPDEYEEISGAKMRSVINELFK